MMEAKNEMKIEIHPNSDIEKNFSRLILSEEKHQVLTVKGKTISNFTEEEKKDGKITRSFEIKDTRGRLLHFRWSVSCPLVKIFTKGKEKLVGLGFIIDETYKHELVSQDKFWTVGCDSCDSYCIECLRG